MRNIRRLVSIVALAAVLSAPTSAMTSSPSASETDPPVVEELIVTARLAGPAWWKVTRGDSTVYIMGLPMGPTPRNQAWDRSVLQRRLTGAHVLILPPSLTAGVRDIPALLRMRAQLRTRTPVTQQLPAPLALRFEQARIRLRQPVSRYQGWDALIASQILRGDSIRRAGLDDLQTVQQVIGVARRQRVPTRAFNYNAAPILRSAIGERSLSHNQLCVEGSLEEVETSPERFRQAAAAWARGDIRRAIDLPHGSDACAEVMFEGFLQQSNRDTVGAIETALRTPGRSVALIRLRSLVTRGGVIEQLRSRGLEIDDPSSPLD